MDNTLRFAAKHDELHRLSFKFTDMLFKLIWKSFKAKDTFRKLPEVLQQRLNNLHAYNNEQNPTGTKAANLFAIFKVQSDQCWDKMAKVRSASVCTTCSGTSQIFFNKNRPKIDPAICSDVMSVCQPWFDSVGQMGRTIMLTHEAVTKLANNRFGNSPWLAGENTAVEIFNKLIFPKKQRVQKSVTGINQRYARLCTKFLRLQGETVLQNLKSQVSEFTEGLRAVDGQLDSMVMNRRVIPRYGTSSTLRWTHMSRGRAAI